MSTRTIDAATLADYTALTTGAALYLRPNAGAIVLTGADRTDFLHRMTTNQINGIQTGQAVVTVLTSPTARILFVFTVVQRGEDLLLLPAEGQTGSLARHLRSQIFFMDAVTVADVSDAYRRMRIMGPQATAVIARLGIDLARREDGAWVAQSGIGAVVQTRFDLPGVELLLPAGDAAATIEQLTAAGATVLTGDDAYTARRIELGRPLPDAELTAEYNPLESGLAWVCAGDKGCYTGQEIIARQITYDKVTRLLVGLVSDQPLSVGADVLQDGRAVGVVTSAAYCPGLGRHGGLAILKRPANAADTLVTVGAVEATVCNLPMSH